MSAARFAQFITDDSEQALGLLKRFGSVTVLNGHNHQIMQKLEGHISFHTAMSAAFPQPAPGTAPGPGPMKVDPVQLKSVLGITDVTFIPGRSALAVVDATLSGGPRDFVAASHDAMLKRQTARKSVVLRPNQIGIDNFSFTPPVLRVNAGTTVTWINNDDVPHLIVNVQNKFRQSPGNDHRRLTGTRPPIRGFPIDAAFPTSRTRNCRHAGFIRSHSTHRRSRSVGGQRRRRFDIGSCWILANIASGALRGDYARTRFAAIARASRSAIPRRSAQEWR